MMFPLTRCALAVLVLLGALAVLSGVRPQWTAALGLEWGDLPGLVKILVNEHRREEAIMRRAEVVARRVADKSEVTIDLVAGRITLLEATARFRKVDKDTGAYVKYPTDLYPGATEEERLCRQVIAWAGYERGGTAGDALVPRLNEELRQHLRDHHGKVELPPE
jgi:hypothetical protein